MRWRILLGLGLAATLGGCASFFTGERCADFGGVQYCLQSSQGLAPFATTRSVVLSRGQETQRLIVNLEVDEQRGIRMAGLTPFGRRVLWIHLHPDNRLEVISDMPIDARQILAGMQFADWPMERVRAGVRGERARVEEVASGAGTVRRLLDGGGIVLSATCEGTRPLCRRALLRYETLGYALEIETLDLPQT